MSRTRKHSILYSTASGYAIRAVAYLARHPEGAFAREIAAQCDLPKGFLPVVLRRLAKGQILGSSKGPHGGFAILRNPAKIRLLDIVEAMDVRTWSSECAMGYPRCSPENRCAMHDSWVALRKCIVAYLKETTVADLAKGTNGHTVREVALPRTR